jgi:hypothetical protein
MVDEYHFKRWERNNEPPKWPLITMGGVNLKAKCCSPIFWNAIKGTNDTTNSS